MPRHIKRSLVATRTLELTQKWFNKSIFASIKCVPVPKQLLFTRCRTIIHGTTDKLRFKLKLSTPNLLIVPGISPKQMRYECNTPHRYSLGSLEWRHRKTFMLIQLKRCLKRPPSLGQSSPEYCLNANFRKPPVIPRSEGFPSPLRLWCISIYCALLPVLA